MKTGRLHRETIDKITHTFDLDLTILHIKIYSHLYQYILFIFKGYIEKKNRK